MTAIPHPSGEGLYIPNMEIADKCDRADPIAHTEMVLEAIDKTEKTGRIRRSRSSSRLGLES
ncbi:hypothetical protein [Streptomyces sp. NPDC058401]|uniref:hypothetical protein n=1 Tax=Streptomyces sp. NPDC058401 TaxID=3346480 RepID=UPI0036473FE9